MCFDRIRAGDKLRIEHDGIQADYPIVYQNSCWILVHGCSEKFGSLPDDAIRSQVLGDDGFEKRLLFDLKQFFSFSKLSWFSKLNDFNSFNSFNFFKYKYKINKIIKNAPIN